MGVWLSEALQEAAVSLQQHLMQCCPARAIKWVERKNLHFTLKFLGDVPETDLPLLKAACEQAARATTFDITVAGLGAFPSLSRPETIWVGVSEGTAPFAALASVLEEQIAVYGIPKSARPFAPHLTLGRVRDLRYCHAICDALQQAGEVVLGRQSVKAFSLIQSRLTPQGPIYTSLSHIALQTPPT